jgi:hypothetical protein
LRREIFEYQRKQSELREQELQARFKQVRLRGACASPNLIISVGDPDQQGLYVFGPPGSGSISQWYESVS